MTSLAAQRRATLLESVRQHYPERDGVIVLWANIEQSAQQFKQQATFYYFTGLHEPGCVVAIDVKTGHSILFVPHTPTRAQWVGEAITIGAQSAQRVGVDEVRYLGTSVNGYTLSALFTAEQYHDFSVWLDAMVNRGGAVFTPCPVQGDFYASQVALIQRLCSWYPALAGAFIDISPIIARMRRKKSREEIELIYKAVALTHAAHHAAAQLITPGRCECEVQAAIEYIFTSNGAASAFVPIVASGPNAATIHYQARKRAINNGELVIVDCGAQINGYCADVSRTYPVGKKWTVQQRDVYALVLQVHDYIASLIKPGMYLNNADQPEQSLHHLATQFFAEHEHKQYFAHGIGHFLGLEVHDVGDTHEPLTDGDVITIEPGLYLPEHNIGVRIENDFWVIKDGAHCLSEDLPVALDEVAKVAG